MRYSSEKGQLVDRYRKRFLIDPICTLPQPYLHNHNAKKCYIYHVNNKSKYVEAKTVLLYDKYIEIQIDIFSRDYGDVKMNLYIHSYDENQPSLSIERLTGEYYQDQNDYMISHMINIMKKKYHIEILDLISEIKETIYEQV